MSGCSTLPHEQEIRLQDSEPLVIDHERVTDDGQLAGLRRVVRVSAHTDKQLTGSRPENQLGQVGCERDDSGVCDGRCLRRRRRFGASRQADQCECGEYGLARPHCVQPYSVIAAMTTAQISSKRKTS